MNSFYNEEELRELGFKYYGMNVKISKKASIYGAENMGLGDNVRIDDFCFLSGNITFGSNIHISAYSSVIAGDAGVEFHDFSGLSSRVSVFACSDDYSGVCLTNPTVPEEFTHVIKKKVIFEKHVIVGASSVVLPGVIVRTGCSIGSMSLLNKSTEPWGVYVGIPAKKVKERKTEMLYLEEKYLSKTENNFSLRVGDKVEFQKTITDNDIEKFAEVSGDYNPLHLDEDYAKTSIFKGRIAHGMLSASFISNVIGNILPGNGTIYLSQSFEFLAPVRIGDEVTVKIFIKHISDRGNALLDTKCYVKNILVINGLAKVKLQKKADTDI